MKYVCLECHWKGNEEDLVSGLYEPDSSATCCPDCDATAEQVDVDDREPDPLTEQPSEVRSEL